MLHCGHQQCVDDRQRVARFAVGFQRIGFDMVGRAFQHCVVDAFAQRAQPPSVGGLCRLFGIGMHLLGIFGEPIRSIRTAAQHHVLDPPEQFGLDVVVDAQHLRIDDAHIHSGLNGMIEERRVHRLAYGIVATEGERKVRDTARNFGVGQMRLDPACRVDEGFGIAVVLRYARGDGQYVGVENDIFGRKARLGQQPVGRSATSILRSKVSACPHSSKSITTAAAP